MAGGDLLDLRLVFKELSESGWCREVRMGEPMERHTTFRVGGPADLFVLPEGEKGLAGVLDILERGGIPVTVIGNGSNLIVSDRGIRGAVVKIADGLADMAADGCVITAGAGCMLSSVATFAWRSGLSGLEFAYGIPGTLGGAVYMNAGAYGGEMGDVISSSVYLKEGGLCELIGGEHAFGYRKSVYSGGERVIVKASLTLNPGERDEIKAKMDGFMAARIEKQPLDLPSAGSVFKRPEGDYAGRLIEAAGLKGRSVGGATVSEKHAGFIVNTGGATASDVRDLIELVREKVYAESGILLECEIRMVGEF